MQRFETTLLAAFMNEQPIAVIFHPTRSGFFQLQQVYMLTPSQGAYRENTLIEDDETIPTKDGEATKEDERHTLYPLDYLFKQRLQALKKDWMLSNDTGSGQVTETYKLLKRNLKFKVAKRIG